MNLIEALILGLVQGLTEFLPVSSSGHLVLVQKLMGVDDGGIVFEVMVHFATLLSVVIYFWKKLWRLFLAILPPLKPELAPERQMIGLLAIGTLPAVVIGLSFKKAFERVYENPTVVSLLLLVTGTLLLLPKLFKKSGESGSGVGLKSAIVMGFGQAFAILPGVSRSGSTIVSGMLAGTRSSDAAEFSFLLAIPAIAGAAVLAVKDMIEEGIDHDLLVNYLAGGAVAFASGLIAIYTVLVSIRRGRFEWFAYYCFAAGILCFLWFKFGALAEVAPASVGQ
ncbi:MAG: undecaprenyl-diphosphate phosphatase [Verrucomicrobiae bacterium]|nr:undecaprenyl-diphosphate phosphatase [Verrucomicrobiae bacterium]MCP5540858.1 undecaprenyl-diphosphate phosphatase [Akkermansiaceae bacterium]